MENNRNIILAVALSLAVVIGWDLLYLQPKMDLARKQQLTEAAQNPPKPAQSEAGAPEAPPVPAGFHRCARGIRAASAGLYLRHARGRHCRFASRVD